VTRGSAGGMCVACKKTIGVWAQAGIRWRPAWAATGIHTGHGRRVEDDLLTCGPGRGERVRLACGPIRKLIPRLYFKARIQLLTQNK
jgi:hypothetical protein